MKRLLLSLTVLGLILLVASVPSPRAGHVFKDKDLKGNLKGDLKGPFGFSFDGTVGGVPVAAIGAFLADGDGNVTNGVRTLSVGGATPVVLSQTFTCTYAVNPDGTGSAACLVVETGLTEHFALVITHSSREFAFVGTDAGVVVRGLSVKQE